MSKGKPTTIIDGKQIELKWRQRGFSCGLWVDPPGQVWEDYVHQTDELIMLIEGALELEFTGRRFRPEIGEEVLIPALVRHTVENVGEGTVRWLYGYKQSPPGRATQQPMETR
ncbi:MAG: cupin domain-containing protein [Nitrospiraceae bacterium]